MNKEIHNTMTLHEYIEGNKTKIREALARGYCSKENENKVLDADLIEAMAKEIEKTDTQTAEELWALAVEEIKSCHEKEEPPPHAGYSRVEASMYSYAKGYNQARKDILTTLRTQLEDKK